MTKAADYVIGRTRRKAVPDDFHIWGAVEGNLKLRKRYNVGGAKIDSWRKASGVLFLEPKREPRFVVSVARTRRRNYQQGPAYDEPIEDLQDFERFDMSRCLGIRGGIGDDY